MKQIITFALVLLISLPAFSQKKELKIAKKAIASGNFTSAINSLSTAKPLLNGAKEKYKIQYYYFLGKATYGKGEDVSKFDATLDAFNTLLEIENKPNATFSLDAKRTIFELKNHLYTLAVADFKKAQENEANPAIAIQFFETAAEKFSKVYDYSKKTDTIALFQSARSNFFGKFADKAIAQSEQLLEIGFTNAGMEYSATSIVTGAVEVYGSKEEMDKKVKMKLAENPESRPIKSQRPFIHKMIINSYRQLEQNEKALEAVQRAEKESPEDYGLLVDEANVYYALGNKEMFKTKLEEAIKINDSDPSLYFNIGVMKSELGDKEGAIASYKKAIEINPEYFDAYNNIGATVLEEAAAIVEEMNKTTNDAKYTKLQKDQEDVYRRALPFYEKAFELNNTSTSVVQTLKGIYYNLEMDAKAKEIQEIYDNLTN